MSDAHVIENASGAITVSAAVLEQIALGSAAAADGARVRRPRRGLQVGIDGGRARVSVELAVRYGAVVPEVAAEVQRRVAAALGSMCGLDVEAVDVSVEELDG